MICGLRGERAVEDGAVSAASSSQPARLRGWHMIDFYEILRFSLLIFARLANRARFVHLLLQRNRLQTVPNAILFQKAFRPG